MAKSNLIFLIVPLFIGCTLEPEITVDVPKGAIDRTTTVNIDWPDDLKVYLKEQLKTQAECEFNALPQNSEGFIAQCTYNCCLWVYEADACVERWCLNLENSCGWELVDWNCLESR